METTIFMITFVMRTTSTRIEFVTFLIATMRIIIFQFQGGVDTSSIYFFGYLLSISQPSGREHVKGSPRDLGHFIFEINVGKRRIRERTTLNLNDIIDRFESI